MTSEIQRLVLFDIDGTLLTSGGIAGRVFGEALADAAGLPIDTSGYSFAGRTDPEIVRGLLGRAGLPAAVVEECLPVALERYVTRFAAALTASPGPRLFPGVRALLDRLAVTPAITTGLLTGNVEAGATIKLDRFGIRHFFRVGAFGSDDADRNRLVPVALARARDELALEFDASQVVVVGDTPRDIACARAHGARVVAVATGSHSEASLAAHRPDALFSDLQDTDAVVGALAGANGVRG